MYRNYWCRNRAPGKRKKKKETEDPEGADYVIHGTREVIGVMGGDRQLLRFNVTG
jgi:hypothetical protein